ncbi:MAG: hypothetical protein ACKO23_07050 [Gemmataceae bacterium]
MRRSVIVLVLVASITLVGCRRVPPSVVKAITGHGAKAISGSAPKVVGRAATNLTEKAVPKVVGSTTTKTTGQPGYLKKFGEKAGKEGAEYGLKKLTGDDKKKK